MDDKNLDLMRVTIERDLERLRNEVARATGDLETFKSQLVQQVADAKVQIGDQAVDKMYKVFTEFRSWALLGVALLVTVGGMSFYQFYTGARQTIETKITDWLSFDKKGALLKESLESIRMRVVLDSLVTRVVRGSMTGSYRSPLELSQAEKSRLISYMLDPDTSESDFRDGARVLGANIGMFYFGVDPRLDELISKTMSRFEVDSFRPRALLDSLSRYQGIGSYALAILNAKNVPNDLRFSAFKALKGMFSGEAEKYAAAHLLEEQYAPLQDELAKSLAAKEQAVRLVDAWLAKKIEIGGGAIAHVMLADSLVSEIPSLNLSTEIDPLHRKWMVGRAAAMLAFAISEGAKLAYDDSSYPRVTLGFRLADRTTFLGLYQLFDRSEPFMEAVTRAASSAGISPDVFVRALTTKGARGEVFGMRAILNTAKLVGVSFGTIDATTTMGSILLVSNDKSTTPSITASFRSRDGNWVTDQIKSCNGLYDAKLSFAYDEAVLRMAQNSFKFEFENGF
ncbi:hypothetical protein [Burkholderia ubonensis]|uniref:hypothetical protein n=1 Tax=Burkholderia ubonensis TaxID=101571 RepID=UPI000841A568|nr:hypothetical protein [Burkholderia ubonensis]AOK60164.1 hypothetical protein WM29_14175 [Burkholderia ubonensis]